MVGPFGLTPMCVREGGGVVGRTGVLPLVLRGIVVRCSRMRGCVTKSALGIRTVDWLVDYREQRVVFARSMCLWAARFAVVEKG